MILPPPPCRIFRMVYVCYSCEPYIHAYIRALSFKFVFSLPMYIFLVKYSRMHASYGLYMLYLLCFAYYFYFFDTISMMMVSLLLSLCCIDANCHFCLHLTSIYMCIIIVCLTFFKCVEYFMILHVVLYGALFLLHIMLSLNTAIFAFLV